MAGQGLAKTVGGAETQSCVQLLKSLGQEVKSSIEIALLRAIGNLAPKGPNGSEASSDALSDALVQMGHFPERSELALMLNRLVKEGFVCRDRVDGASKTPFVYWLSEDFDFERLRESLASAERLPEVEKRVAPAPRSIPRPSVPRSLRNPAVRSGVQHKPTSTTIGARPQPAPLYPAQSATAGLSSTPHQAPAGYPKGGTDMCADKPTVLDIQRKAEIDSLTQRVGSVMLCKLPLEGPITAFVPAKESALLRSPEGIASFVENEYSDEDRYLALVYLGGRPCVIAVPVRMVITSDLDRVNVHEVLEKARKSGAQTPACASEVTQSLQTPQEEQKDGPKPAPNPFLSEGESVYWTSQAGGVSKRKEGRVIGCVPAGASAAALLPAGLSRGRVQFEVDVNPKADRVLIEVNRGEGRLSWYYAPFASVVRSTV